MHVARIGVALLFTVAMACDGASPTSTPPSDANAPAPETGAVDANDADSTADSFAESAPDVLALPDGDADAPTGVRFDPSHVGPKGAPPHAACEAVASGTCRYVSPSGAGTTCTQAAPCRVKTVLDTLVPGDVVVFLAGTYDAAAGSLDRIVLDKYHPIATTASAPVVFRGAPSSAVVMKGNGVDPCVWIDGTGHLTFEGMVYDGCFEAGVRVGEDAPEATSHVTIQYNEFKNITCNDNMGATMVNAVADLTFRNNEVHDFVKGTSRGLGLVVFRATNLTVEGNEFHDLANGIYYKHGEATVGAGGTTRIVANYFHATDDWALGVNQNRAEIAYDLFKDTGGVMLFQADGTVADFLFDVRLHHDTFVRSNVAPMQRSDGFSGAQRITVDHSIFLDGILDVWRYGLDADFDKGVGFASDGNCFFATTGAPKFDYFASSSPMYGPKGAEYDFSGWRALGFDGASQVIDPKIDETTLHAASPACATYGAYGD